MCRVCCHGDVACCHGDISSRRGLVHSVAVPAGERWSTHWSHPARDDDDSASDARGREGVREGVIRVGIMESWNLESLVMSVRETD